VEANQVLHHTSSAAKPLSCCATLCVQPGLALLSLVLFQAARYLPGQRLLCDAAATQQELQHQLTTCGCDSTPSFTGKDLLPLAFTRPELRLQPLGVWDPIAPETPSKSPLKKALVANSVGLTASSTSSPSQEFYSPLVAEFAG